MRISIPQPPEERQLVGTLSRKAGQFVFLLNAPEAEPYSLGRLTSWKEAEKRAQTLLYFTRLIHKISPDLPPHLQHMRNLKIAWRFDPRYDAKTRAVLEEELLYPALLLTNENYHRAMKKLGKDDTKKSTAAQETFATVDGRPLGVLSHIEVRRGGGIEQAIFLAGSANWIRTQISLK